MAQQSTLGDKLQALNGALSDAQSASNIDDTLAKIQLANSIYAEVFQSDAQEVDSDTDNTIESALIETEFSLEEGNTLQAEINRRIIEESLYKVSFMKIEDALEQSDAATLIDWFSVIEKGLGISEKSTLTSTIKKIQKSETEISSYSDTIKKELLDIFKLKTIEGLENTITALNNDNINNTKKFSTDALYYYKIWQRDIEEKISKERAEELSDRIQEMVDMANDELPFDQIEEDIKAAKGEADIIIKQYETGSTSEIITKITGIQNRLVSIDNNYSYAVDSGQIIYQYEYDDALYTISDIIGMFNENKGKFSSISQSDTTLIESNLSKIEEMIKSKGDYSDFELLVEETLSGLENLASLSDEIPEIAPLVYIENIQELLDQISTSYRNGNTPAALSLATAAYLDNYQFIEQDVALRDNELMEKIQRMLREELKEMISTGASPDQVDEQINTIRQDLDTARAIIPEFGSMAMLVMAVSIVSIIAISVRYQRFTTKIKN